ncbi:MAG: signal peptide peptidase SppA [Bacteroidales bacterium]|nr:signal peptide peptidase SppA [Bacteroidales bacterium]
MKTFWKIFFGSLLGCIAALLLFFLIGMGMLGSAFSSNKDTSTVASSAVLKIDFNSQVVEHETMGSIGLGNLSQLSQNNAITILDMVKAIQYAETDPAIKFIYMNTDKANLSLAHAEELRDALLRFRQSGKAIVAYGTSFNNLSYYLASVADKVIVHGFGDATITGLSSSMMFFKDLLDKIGVNMQLVRHGKYKAAAEQLIKNQISPENYEQNKVMVDNIWNVICDDICASRDFTKEQFNSWIENLDMLDANSLLALGVVDEAFYKEQLDSYLCSLFGVNDIKDVKYVSVDRYASARLKENYKVKDKVAIVYAEGDIVSEGSTSLQGGAAIVGSKFVKELAALRKDSTVKAVVLRVNSPGGSALEAEMIRHELQLLRECKPVIASYGGYAASGGYWISAQTDKIFTDKTTITGSIGVFSLVPSVKEAVKKLNINTATINTHRHSDMGQITRDLDEEEMVYLQRSIEIIYNQFTNLVAEGRNMSPERVDELGQGRVWTGTDAVAIGLADYYGGLYDAVQYAAAASGLTDYRLVEVPVVKTTYEKLLEMLDGGGMETALVPNGLESVAECYKFLKTYEKPIVYARLPYLYNIR